mmetsp:Transcript_15486/g.46367  ORF Transcript_15486/g.46367 Transcript_15486/m.46367 type:complete len:201 (+) Transcript_15486:991-1593(+)
MMRSCGRSTLGRCRGPRRLLRNRGWRDGRSLASHTAQEGVAVLDSDAAVEKRGSTTLAAVRLAPHVQESQTQWLLALCAPKALLVEDTAHRLGDRTTQRLFADKTTCWRRKTLRRWTRRQEKATLLSGGAKGRRWILMGGCWTLNRALGFTLLIEALQCVIALCQVGHNGKLIGTIATLDDVLRLEELGDRCFVLSNLKG